MVEALQRAQDQLEMFQSGVKRIIHPHECPVGFERDLHDQKMTLIPQARGDSSDALIFSELIPMWRRSHFAA